jgi:hypothetical protein
MPDRTSVEYSADPAQDHDAALPLPSPEVPAGATDDSGRDFAAVHSRGPRADVNVDIRVNHNRGGVVAGVVENVRRMLNYHELTPDYVTACAEGFAEPPNLHEAQRRLNDHHIVVLVGAPESGRHDTAVTLLHQQPGVVLREVRRETGDRLDVAALGIEQRSGWLLDLRGESHLTPHSAELSWVSATGCASANPASL